MRIGHIAREVIDDGRGRLECEHSFELSRWRSRAPSAVLFYFSPFHPLVCVFTRFFERTESQNWKLFHLSSSPLSQAFPEAIIASPSCNLFSCAVLFPASLRLLKRRILVFFFISY